MKATRLDGTKLNPRKPDLHLWREAFADRLRQHGVDCVASPRAQRLQLKRGEKQSVRHMKARGEHFDRVGRGALDRERREKALRAESHLLTGFLALANGLANSDREEDRQLGLDLAAHAIDSASRTSRDRQGSRDR